MKLYFRIKLVAMFSNFSKSGQYFRDYAIDYLIMLAIFPIQVLNGS